MSSLSRSAKSCTQRSMLGASGNLGAAALARSRFERDVDERGSRSITRQSARCPSLVSAPHGVSAACSPPFRVGGDPERYHLGQGASVEGGGDLASDPVGGRREGDRSRDGRNAPS